MFLKLPEIIIIGFGENNVSYPKYIYVMNFGGDGDGIHGPPDIFCLLLNKTEKVQEHALHKKSNSTSF